MNLATILVGPLVAPECRRAAGRGWVILSRTLMALLIASISLIALAWWAINQQYEPSYKPEMLVPFTGVVIESLVVFLALILTPALLAGSLAGEKERGSIGLLLSTRVDSREIVLGRTLGKLSLIGSLLIACLPFQVLFAVLNDMPSSAQAALIALPMAVGFGAGGLGVAASAIAKRGRNALLAIYFLEALLLLAFALANVPGMAWTADVLGALNPFAAIAPLVRLGRTSAAGASLALWLAMGAAGIAYASWVLRSAYLRLVDGKVGGRSVRLRPVPALIDQPPMIWKERYIERVHALGWFGRVLNWAVIAYLAGGSLVLAGWCLYEQFHEVDYQAYDQLVGWIDRLYGRPASLVCGLIQLAAGLRAAVAVSSERERGTWDGLLTSPLTGREIIAGKLRGSLLALVPLILASVLSWTVAFACGAMGGVEFGAMLGYAAVGVVFAVSAGVRASLTTQTATRAMTYTVAVLCASYAVLALVAALAMMVLTLLVLFTVMFATQMGLLPPTTRPGLPAAFFPAGWNALMLGSFLILALMIAAEMRMKFDKLAGRMPSEGAERPGTPVWLTSSSSQVQATKGEMADVA